MENMGLWDRVCETDPKHTKHVAQRGGFTAIDAQYQVQKATEVFGPVGSGWGYECEHSVITVDGASLAVSDVVLWYRIDDNDKGVYGPVRACNALVSNKGRIDEDAWKKATTDAITKLLSHLGFNADVFLGRFDDNRYVQRMEKTFEPNAALVNKYLDGIREAAQVGDDLGGMQLIKELRAEDEEAWITVWGMCNTQEKKVIREWGTKGEKGS